MRMRAWEGVLARRPYACALTTVSMTIIMIPLFNSQKVFKNKRSERKH